MSADAVAGTGLHDLHNLTTSIIDGEWVASGLHGALAGVGGASLVGDPFGTLAAWGVGWIVEHLQPLAGWYDNLAGEPDLIRAKAKDMYASAAAITALADDTVVATRHALGPLTGAAVHAGRFRGHEIGSSMVELGNAAHAMGQGLEKAAALVEGARSFIRDVIAEIVVWIGTKLGPGMVSLVTDLADLLGRKIPRARKVFDWLTTSMSALSKLLEQVRDALAVVNAAAKKVAARAPVPVPSIPDLGLPQSIARSGGEMVLGITARAEDDARNRPLEPSATRVPHSARQGP